MIVFTRKENRTGVGGVNSAQAAVPVVDERS
jgi:hypothetical protein